MGTSAPWKPVMLPVRLSPAALKVKVVSAICPPRPGTWAVHFPLTSAAMATRLIAINKVAERNNFFIVMAKTLRRRGDVTGVVKRLQITKIQADQEALKARVGADGIVAGVDLQHVNPE